MRTPLVFIQKPLLSTETRHRMNDTISPHVSEAEGLSRRSALAFGLGGALAVAGAATGAAFSGAPASARPGAHADGELDFANALKRVDAGQGIFELDGWYIWGGTPIRARRDRGRGRSNGYYLFYSRWPHGSVGRDPGPEESIFYDFHGWLKYSEVAVAWSASPRGPYRHLRTVLSSTRDEARWDRFNAHNPHVREFGGRYYLYFIANNPLNTPEPWLSQQPDRWMRYHAGQRIGVMVADSVDDLVEGRGVRSDQPIIAPDYVETFQMVVNPSVTEMPGGGFLMTYKTWDSRMKYVNVVATADSPEGPFTYRGVALQGSLRAEDPYVWYDADRERYFAIVKDWYQGSDRTDALTPQFGALGLVESRDGFHWGPAAHSVVSLRQLELADGSTVALERLERPQLLFDRRGVPTTLHAAMSVRAPDDGTQNVAIPLNLHR